MFYAQPDGRSVLARFAAHRLDAPAARLRVFGAGRRLLGTAGMLRAGDALYGELWLALGRETVVTSELEAPGLRGVHRTTHRLRPAPRWTIHWLRVRGPDAVMREIHALPTIRNAVHAGLLRTAGTTGNPTEANRATTLTSHLEFLRQSAAAWELASRFGIPVAPAGVLGSAKGAWPTLPMVLTGSGVNVAFTRWDGDEPFRWWEAPDGSRILLATVAPDATSDALEFGTSVAAMAGRVARWIETLGGRTPASNYPHVVVLDTSADADAMTKVANVEEWNRRFAYPRLIVGPSDAMEAWTNLVSAGASIVLQPTRDTPPPRDQAALRSEAERLDTERARQLETLTGVMRRAIGTPEGGDVKSVLASLGAIVNAASPGALVFNPTPIRRTDLAVMPNGVRRIVTDVPAWGYTFVPEVVWREDTRGPAVRTPLDAGGTIETELLRLELDEQSGAIRSLVMNGNEWAGTATNGLNAVADGRLEQLRRDEIDGLGSRLVAERWSPARGSVRTVVTVYDALPFVDVENDAEARGGDPMEYYFHWWVDDPLVAWDIPAGYEERRGAIEHIEALRWIRIASSEGHAVLASSGAHHGAFLPPGILTSYAPAGRTRFRLWTAPAGATVDMAWRSGYALEPFITVPSRGGGSRLPRYASLLRVEPESVMTVGLVPVHQGAVLYLLNVSAEPQFATVGAGMLRFEGARVADFLGRETGEVAGRLEDGVLVSIPARAAVALRLDGLGLNA